MRHGIDEGNSQHPRPIGYDAAVADLRGRSDGLQPFVIVNAASQYAAEDVPAWRDAGAAVAVYWYGSAGGSPEEQASAALRFGVPVWCDLEAGSITASWINAFCTAVQKGGRPAGWYDDISVSEELRSQISFPLWLAAPSLTATDPLPAPCVMQQLAAGPIAGISAPADIDVWRGSDNQFLSLFDLPIPAPTPDPGDEMPVLTLGDRSRLVMALQGALKALGLYEEHWLCNGNYGNDTNTAVHAFQRAHGIPEADHFGPECWAALAALEHVA